MTSGTFCRNMCAAAAASAAAAAAAGHLTLDVEQQSADVSAPVNDDDEKRKKNRSAARKCREKRLERQRVMRQQVVDVGTENTRLEARIHRLRNRVQQLQSLLAEHRLGQCRLYGLDVSSATSLHSNSTMDLDEL